jgi:uncharacterized protein
MTVTIAVLSDTHGLLCKSVVERIQDVDHILHAGDVGDPVILEALRTIAPVTAIRGNVDTAAWARELPETETFTAGSHDFYIIHNLDDIDLDPRAGGFAGVIYGHTHRPSIEYRNGVLYLNPGSIGPRRFSLPISFAMLRIEGERVDPQLIELDD